MDFRLLGPLEVETDGRTVTPTRPRERAVLALLLLRAGRIIGADELVEAVWGEEPPPTARTALQGVVSSLRRRLGAERIETRAPGYRLVMQSGDRYDVADFEEHLAAAATAGPAERARLLDEALSLFRGEPLAGLAAVALQPDASRLDELRLKAAESSIDADLELGRHVEVVPRLELLIADQPLREGLRGQLMLALYRCGRQADALRVAQDARRVLATELGVEPGPSLQRLERQILDHDPDLMEVGAPMAFGGADSSRAIAHGTATYLAVHDPSAERGLRQRALAEAVRHGGVEVSSAKGIILGFARARDAAVTAAAMQRRARHEGPGLRIGLASDAAHHLAAVAHPGQVVLSRETQELLREAPLHEVDVRELGAHRLADLAPAQPLYQLMARGLDVDFPATQGLEARPTNLPVQPTALVGRVDEIAEVARLLREPPNRLVTLVGTGGTGKTRLAVHVAAELLDDAPDGTWFVALDALVDPALVVPAIATTVGQAQYAADDVAAFARELRGRRTLLVLDNFEHVLPAAEAVSALLREVPGLKVLVTSRVPLKLAGELVVDVPPLPAPPADPAAVLPAEIDSLAGIGSVALFIDRARAARPEFALTVDNAPAVAALCRALDGLPLAVELAASQVGLASPASVLERLDRGLRRLRRAEQPAAERHMALQATIDWSHDLLEPDSQDLFANVAIFAGGWTLLAAESVCDRARDVIGALGNLVDHSLVRVGGTEPEPRFGMLETIREYAAGRLDTSGRRSELAARHVAYFQALAEAAEPHLRGNPGEWVARLERDHDNLRAAIDRVAARGDAAAEARLAGTLWRFWYLAGHLAEGRQRLEHALAAHREPTPLRAKALIGAAVMAVNTEDPAEARRTAEEAIRLYRALDDAWGVAYAGFMLGAALGALGDLEGARSAEETSLRAFRELGDEHSALLVSRNLAGTLEDLGDHAAAEVLYRENLRRARLERNGRLEATTLGALATMAFDAGRVADATIMLRESLRIHRELSDRLDTAVDLARAAQVLALSGQADVAARLVGALGAVREQLGARGRRVESASQSTLATLRRQLTEQALHSAVRDGGLMPIEEAIESAISALR